MFKLYQRSETLHRENADGALLARSVLPVLSISLLNVAVLYAMALPLIFAINHVRYYSWITGYVA
jgi:hypothetical protein